jgi:hypothetical protein
MVYESRTSNETVGYSPMVASTGRDAADSVQTSDVRTSTSWKRIGRIERHLRGVKISFHDIGVSHLLYISERDIQRITTDRVPCDVVKIDQTSSGDIILNTEGLAYRSQSGQALILKVPKCAQADIVAPWKSFLAVLEGRQQAAPLSIMQKTERAENRHQKTTSTFPRGNAAGWF